MKEIETNVRGQGTRNWIKEQCDLAKTDVDEGAWSSDSESESDSEAESVISYHDFPPSSSEAED